MTSAADVIREARRWIGTPWEHQGRRLGEGVDCVGVAIGAGAALGLVERDYRSYARTPDPRVLLAHISAYCERVSTPEPGAIGLFRWRRDPQHVGIFGDSPEGLTLIHAWERVGRCVETTFDSRWRVRLMSVWRLRGVEPWRS
jgi:hypothetical protein